VYELFIMHDFMIRTYTIWAILNYINLCERVLPICYQIVFVLLQLQELHSTRYKIIIKSVKIYLYQIPPFIQESEYNHFRVKYLGYMVKCIRFTFKRLSYT
jgi:hypothetical protein